MKNRMNVRPNLLNFHVNSGRIDQATQTARLENARPDLSALSEVTAEVFNALGINEENTALLEARKTMLAMTDEMSYMQEDETMYTDDSRREEYLASREKAFENFDNYLADLPISARGIEGFQHEVQVKRQAIETDFDTKNRVHVIQGQQKSINRDLADLKARVYIQLEKGTAEGRALADSYLTDLNWYNKRLVETGTDPSELTVQNSKDLADMTVNTELSLIFNRAKEISDDKEMILFLERELNRFDEETLFAKAQAYAEGIDYIDEDILYAEMLKARKEFTRGEGKLYAMLNKARKTVQVNVEKEQREHEEAVNKIKFDSVKDQNDYVEARNGGDFIKGNMLLAKNKGITVSYTNKTEAMQDTTLMGLQGYDVNRLYSLSEPKYAVRTLSDQQILDIQNKIKENPKDGIGIVAYALEVAREDAGSNEIVPQLKHIAKDTKIPFKLLEEAYLMGQVVDGTGGNPAKFDRLMSQFQVDLTEESVEALASEARSALIDAYSPSKNKGESKTRVEQQEVVNQYILGKEPAMVFAHEIGNEDGENGGGNVINGAMIKVANDMHIARMNLTPNTKIQRGFTQEEITNTDGYGNAVTPSMGITGGLVGQALDEGHITGYEVVDQTGINESITGGIGGQGLKSTFDNEFKYNDVRHWRPQTPIEALVVQETRVHDMLVEMHGADVPREDAIRVANEITKHLSNGVGQYELGKILRAEAKLQGFKSKDGKSPKFSELPVSIVEDAVDKLVAREIGYGIYEDEIDSFVEPRSTAVTSKIFEEGRNREIQNREQEFKNEMEIKFGGHLRFATGTFVGADGGTLQEPERELVAFTGVEEKNQNANNIVITANSVASAMGLDVTQLMGQWAMESDWGTFNSTQDPETRELRRQNYALFGIKLGSSKAPRHEAWGGRTFEANGSTWRAYDSVEEAMLDYAVVTKANGYDKDLTKYDPDNPDYAVQVKELMEQFGQHIIGR